MKKNMTVFLIFLALCIGTISVYGAEHPVLNDFYNGMLSYGDRIIVRENIVAKKTAVQTFTGQTVDEFKTYIQTNLPKNPTVRASYEKEVARLGQLYNLEGDADNAKKVLHAIILSAQNYETIKDLPPANEFFKSANLTPAFLVIAYDNVYTYNGFAEFDTLYGTDVRALIDRYFTSIAEKIYNDNKNIYINNLGGYAIKNLMGTGVILEKPDIIRYSIVMMDSAFDPSQWHGDGMWSEGTVSYGQQLVGNTLEAANALKKYVDPPGYVDKILNIKLNKTDLSTRWPMLEKIKATNTGAKYVNDSLMAFHDTHPNPKVSNNPNLPLTNFDPVELNHFGMYAMKSGNQTDAQQVNLLFPPISEGIPYGGGHYHGNFLSLSMFAGGMEVLPDAGYPFDVENNRYFHMSPVTHNESWISSIGKNATLGLNYDEYKSKSTRASVIAYDNKSADSMVQLIEASSLQPTDENIDTKRRLLFQIKMTESRSYTFDLQRLKGGNVHENFLRSSEDEDTTLTTDLTLVPLLENDIGTYLKNNKKIGQMTNTSSPFKEPKLDNTGKAFSFSWKGITSGTTFKAHMKEVKDGQTFVSTMPSLRRTEGDPLLKDNFPVPHMYMRREVSPNDVTEFGGVYEGYRNEELPLVNGVKWSEVLGNSMSTIAVVDLGEKEDIIYINDNLTPYTYDGVEFSGNYAILRRNKATKQPEWGYLNGDGYIKTQGKMIRGVETFSAGVTAVSRSANGENKIILDKNVPGEFVNEWVVSNLPDQTGIAHKIVGIPESNTLSVHNDVGYSISNGATKWEYFPSKVNTVTNNFQISTVTKDKLIDRTATGNPNVTIRKSNFGTLKTEGVVFTENGVEVSEILPGKTYDAHAYLMPNQNFFVAEYLETYNDDVENSVAYSTLSRVFDSHEIGENSIRNIKTPTEFVKYYENGKVKTKILYKSFVWDM